MPTEEDAVESERREHERYSVNIQVEIMADTGKTSGLMVGTSLEGLRIRTTTLIKPSSDVVISFSTGDKVILFAGVVWVLDKIKKGLPSYLAGLKINSVSVNNKELQGIAERISFMQDLLT